MNRILASLLSLSLLAVACAFPSPGANPPPTETLPAPTFIPPTETASDPFQIPWDDRSVFQSGLVESARWALDELDGASVYRIELTIADDLHNITARQGVRYTNNEEITLSEVRFRLFPNILGGEMRVSNLLADGQVVTPRYELSNSLMIVPLPTPLEPQKSVVFQMDFSVVVPQSLEMNYGVLAHYDGVLTLAHAYPMIAVYDEEGWNAEIPPQSGDVVFADASFYLVRVTAPAGLTLVTSGVEVSRDEARQVQALTVASGPARDFYIAASPKYEETSQAFGDVAIRSYALPGSKNGSQMAVEVAARAMEIFSERYAPYPYTELDIIASPTLALGVEYPGVIAVASRVYDLGGGRFGRSADDYLESTVVHEVGHQWFYNLVGNDQLDAPWLDESLTQFITLQYYSDAYGEQGADGFLKSLNDRWARSDNYTMPIGLPVAAYNSAEYGAIVYGRGPIFFVALREAMGARAFDDFLKDYTVSLSWGVSSSQTLRSFAERHCGCDLQPLFDEWVYP